jgi:hypothetical protein
MEELMERNRRLSNLAGLKSKHSSRGSSYLYAGLSVKSSNERGRDPVEVNNMSAVSCLDEIEPSFCPAPFDHDDQSAYSFTGSTILTVESLKKLEPESSYSVAGKVDEKGPKYRNLVGREGKGRIVNDQNKDISNEVVSPEPRRVKFPGGEYFGSLNRRGQKHGVGEMKYDNGNEYEGEWINDKRDGKGTTKYSSGNVYIGKYNFPGSLWS